MELNQKIAQYYKLSQQQNLLNKHLEALKKEIKNELLSNDKFKVDERTHRKRTEDGFTATVRLRRGPPKYDSLLLHDLLVKKKAKWCFKLVPDLDLVEQAYIEGYLSDIDLRAINKGSNISLALEVEKD